MPDAAIDAYAAICRCCVLRYVFIIRRCHASVVADDAVVDELLRRLPARRCRWCRLRAARHADCFTRFVARAQKFYVVAPMPSRHYYYVIVVDADMMPFADLPMSIFATIIRHTLRDYRRCRC